MMKEIQAGKPVSKFLKDINDYFNEIKTIHTDELPKKQDKIFVATNNGTVTVGDDIKVINGVPTGGKDGDILIVYEE